MIVMRQAIKKDMMKVIGKGLPKGTPWAWK